MCFQSFGIAILWYGRNPPPPLFLKIKMSNANIALMDISSH